MKKGGIIGLLLLLAAVAGGIYYAATRESEHNYADRNCDDG